MMSVHLPGYPAIRRLSGVLVFLSLVGCESRQGVPAEAPEVGIGVESPDGSLPPDLAAAIGVFYRAIETDDHEARIGMFTDDAMMLPDHGPVIEGREAIAEVIRGGAGWVFRLRDRVVLDTQVDGDLAYTVNAYSYTYHALGEDPQWHPTKNVHLWKRGPDGIWRLHVDIWNSDGS